MSSWFYKLIFQKDDIKKKKREKTEEGIKIWDHSMPQENQYSGETKCEEVNKNIGTSSWNLW